MATVSGKNSHKLSRTEIIQLVEELQENQANLQAQNAELRSKVQSKERHLKKYAEFYDFAPIGYLSLEENGIIRDINLTVCELLGEDRQNLKNRTVLDFIHEDDKQIFSDHMKRLFRTRGSDICHIKVKYKEKCYFIELRGIAVEDEDTGRLYCRCSMFNISDRVEAETELEEQRKLMEAVFEHIESSIIVCDQKGDLSFLNKAATNLFGHNQIGHQSEDWTKNLNLYREDGETLLEIEEMPLYKAWKGKKVKNEEVHIVAEGGDMRTLLASGQPIYDKQGTNMGAVIALHDITDRKRAEKELKSYRDHLEDIVEKRTKELKTANDQLSEEIAERSRLQKQYLTEKHFAESLISSQPGLFFLVNEGGQIRRWNKNLETYSNYSTEEIKNMLGWNLLDDRDIEITRFRLNMALKTGKAIGKVRLLSKNGGKTPFLLTGVAMKFDGENCVIVTGVDITAYEKERAEKMRFFQVLERSRNEIYIFDAESYNFIYVNEGARVNLGYSNGELIKMKAYDTKPDISENKFREIVQPLINKEQEKVVLQTVHMRREGSTYPVEIHLQLIEQEYGNVFVAIVWDITNRLEIEKQLEKALHEKEVLLEEIHHRVKNNLSIVSSLLTIQAGYVQDPKVKELFSESESRVKSMAMIHEMLYQQKNFSKIDFESYIKKLIHHISSNYRSPKTSIKTKVDVENVTLEIGTAVPCALLINELLTNSYKHAFKGREEGFVGVSLIKIDKTLKLVVEDNGVGLKSGNDKGNTLGMTLVNGLAGQLHGKLDIQSESGAKFTIHFPHPE